MRRDIEPGKGTPARSGDRTSRNARGDIDARAIARIRTAAAIVRHRQESLYDRLAERFRLAFEEGVDKSREAMDVAAEKAREQLTAAGVMTRQQGERLKVLLLRDLDRAAAQARLARDEGAEHLHPARQGSGALASLASVLESVGDRVHVFAHRADEALTYRTGEVTCAGTLICTKCKAPLQFRQTGTVPPCPACSSAVFRKRY
jgi:isocitrate dehydrogenase